MFSLLYLFITKLDIEYTLSLYIWLRHLHEVFW